MAKITKVVIRVFWRKVNPLTPPPALQGVFLMIGEDIHGLVIFVIILVGFIIASSIFWFPIKVSRETFVFTQICFTP